MGAPARNPKRTRLSQRESSSVSSATPLPLNLLHLAKAEPGVAKSVLSGDLSVQALTAPLTLKPAALWLLVLEGEIIADLPHGDFRVLKVGDSLRLEAPEAVLTPLEEAVFLFTALTS